MILVDTSIWIDHLRVGEETLAALLDRELVLTHPFIIGELALGNLRQRDLTLTSLGDLPHAIAAENDDVLRFIADERLFGLGIGFVDAHLLTAARLTPGAFLWTRDKKLKSAAERLGLAARSSQTNEA